MVWAIATLRAEMLVPILAITAVIVVPILSPRIIGKAGSMITMIKDITDCRIIIGQNGLTWISGTDPDKEAVAVEAIKLIEENSHKIGLTDEIKKFLESKIKGVKKNVQKTK